MKKIIYTLSAFVVLALGAVSCDSYFDVELQDQSTLEEMFCKSASVRKLAAHMYAYLPKEENPMDGTSEGGFSGRTDARQINASSYVNNCFDLRVGNYSPASITGYNLWENYYKAIAHCTLIIENIHLDVEDNDMVRSYVEAEARFMRAYYYFLLFRTYGPVIIWGDKPAPSDVKGETLDRNTLEDNINFIVSELDKAIAVLPVKLSEVLAEDSNMGRPTKGAALALKSRVLLYAASPLFNGNKLYAGMTNYYGEEIFPQNYDEQKWRDAKDAAWEVIKLQEYVDDLLKSTRPISDSQYLMVKQYIAQYKYDISYCENKDTAIRLLLETSDVKYAQFISLADVLKILERIQYERYGSENIRKLNLKNKDRKFITSLIDAKFTKGDYVFMPYSNAIRECYERQAIWAGLLHHIHYKPVNEAAKAFVDGIRSGKNISAMSGFEKAMMRRDIQSAVEALEKGKGSGAILRKLNYILSRCVSEEEVQMVIRHIETENPIILIQLLMQYEIYKEEEARFFRFTKFNRLRKHKETLEEMFRRQSVISEKIRSFVKKPLIDNLSKIYHGRLGKVYISDAMKSMAIPIQENISMGGYGTLCRGSRVAIPVEKDKKLRVFTYWEKVNDIDLSAFGLTTDGRQREFSWRAMWHSQSSAITFSGDQTSGYNGGSEFFDIDIDRFKAAYPDVKYLVFCNNVFSRTTFERCICRAGYMIRDMEDSGQIFEPKTVQSSYEISCNSRFVYMFGIDMDTNELVWLNMTREGMTAVAGTRSMDFLMDYFVLGKVFTVKDLFSMLATEVVTDIMEADVVVTDETVETKEGAEIIRSYDFEKILAYMNT